MSLADPLDVPETGVVVSMLESMQCQLTAAHKLLALLRARRDETSYAAVEERLIRVDAHLREAVRSMHAPVTQHTAEYHQRSHGSQPGLQRIGRSTEPCSLRERGDILSRAMQARKLNS